VDRGVNRYRDTFLDLFLRVAKQRVPGTERMSDEDLRNAFRERPPEEWVRRAQVDPVTALKELRQFERLEVGNAG